MHQVLCTRSNEGNDVRCSVCGQGFLVLWSRFSRKEQDECRVLIQEQLRNHHAAKRDQAAAVHPEEGFIVPEWVGSPGTSLTELLTGSRPGLPLSISGMFRVRELLEESR
jgi:hypothetical protein